MIKLAVEHAIIKRILRSQKARVLGQNQKPRKTNKRKIERNWDTIGDKQSISWKPAEGNICSNTSRQNKREQRSKNGHCKSSDKRTKWHASERESILIVFGLKAAEVSDSEVVENYFDAADINSDKIRLVKRLRTKVNSMIQVVMVKPEDRNEALKIVKNLKVLNYEGVSLRENRTPYEQIEFSRLYRKENDKNEEMKELDLLD